MHKFQILSKKRRIIKNSLKRMKRSQLFFAGCIALLVIGGVIAWGVQATTGVMHREREAPEKPGNAIEIVMECPGWTDANVEVGVFISGNGVQEHVLFSGSGSQVIYVPSGSYELVPQMPRLMLADGRVLEASEPILLQFETDDGGYASASLVYEPVETNSLDVSELALIAETSFVDEQAAHRAISSTGE